jgi:hypothetical protein
MEGGRLRCLYLEYDLGAADVIPEAQVDSQSLAPFDLDGPIDVLVEIALPDESSRERAQVVVCLGIANVHPGVRLSVRFGESSRTQR